MGSVHTITRGVTHGPSHGVDRGNPLASVPKDATSNVYVPLTQAEWSNVFSAASVGIKTVSSSWGFQDASGNVAASVGTNLTQVGTSPTYQQSVTGWTRKGIRLANSSTTRFSHGSGTGDSPASTSTLWIGYMDLTGSTAGIFMHAGVTTSLRLATGPLFNLLWKNVNNAGATNPATGGVKPFVLLNDITNSRAVGYSDTEKITATYASIVDGVKGFGSQGSANGAGMDVLFGATFAGASAEWTDQQVQTVLTTLGWTITWSA